MLTAYYGPSVDTGLDSAKASLHPEVERCWQIRVIQFIPRIRSNAQFHNSVI